MERKHLSSVAYDVEDTPSIIQKLEEAHFGFGNGQVPGLHEHTNTVMMIMTLTAMLLALIPFKFILMVFILYGFMMTSKLGKLMQNEQGNRCLKEWWDSIPVIPVET